MTYEVMKSLTDGGSDLTSKINKLIDNRLSNIHTTTIGIIKVFDSETQLATVQPAIKRVVETDGQTFITYSSEEFPLLVNVPVIFPGGGEYFMTFPVTAEDECLIFSMERSINNWKSSGGLQDPSHYKRKLSFKDAIVMVGIQSQANSLPEFNATEPELRNRDGSVKLTMTDDGISLMDSTDNAVRYSELEASFNQLKTDLNSLITAYNTHVHVTTATIGPANTAVGLLSATLAQGTASTATITAAKIDEITVP